MIGVADLDRLKATYETVLSVDVLAKAEADINTLLKQRFLSEQQEGIKEELMVEVRKIRARAEALAWRIGVKAAALTYFEQGYRSEDYAKLIGKIDELFPQAQQKGYGKTAQLMERVKVAAGKVGAVMADALALIVRIRNNEGEPVTTSVETCVEVSAAFADKIAACNEWEGMDAIFADADFPDVKAAAIKALQSEKAFADSHAQALRLKDVEGFVKESARPVERLKQYEQYPYYPLLPEGERALAGAIVLSTPIEAEAEFFAVKNSENAVRVVEANAFAGKTAATIRNIFTLFRRNGYDALIFGLDTYHDANQSDVVAQAAVFGQEGGKAYLVNLSGSSKLYDEGIKAVIKAGLSSTRLSHYYLSMPNYRETVSLLSEKGMLVSDADGRLRKEMPFMGFVGLNAVIKECLAGNDLYKVGAAYSADNEALVRKYLLNVPTQSLLVDGGWGQFSDDWVDNTRKAFDYDDLSEVDRRNVRKIMESRLTMYQKSGCIARYCTMAGADKSLWRGMDAEEKEERLAFAVKMLYRVLEIGYEPEVVFLDKKDTNGSYGGRCCSGGKIIEIVRDYYDNYDYAVDTVCHECHHAFQRMVMDSPWKDWFREEMYVTAGIRKTWIENDHSYFDNKRNKKAYMVQILECEARAFAEDCLQDSDEVWNELAFE